MQVCLLLFLLVQFQSSFFINIYLLPINLIGKPIEHIHTPTYPVFIAFSSLFLVGAISGHILECFLHFENGISLWLPSTMGALAFLVMSVSSYTLWGIASFGIAVTLSLLLAVQEFDKLVLAVMSIFFCAFIISLRGTEKKFSGSSVLYHAFGWGLICGPVYLWLGDSTPDMFIRAPAMLLVVLVLGNLPDGEPRVVRFWHQPSMLMISFSCTVLIAIIKEDIFTYLAIVAAFGILVTTIASQKPFIYGPFTSSERQAQVWLTLAYLLTAVHATDADGMQGGVVPIRTLHVLAVFLGASASFAVCALCTLACQVR